MKNSKKMAEKRLLVTQFGEGCHVCGYNTCLRALQFHHLDSTEKKDFSGGKGNVSYDEVRAHPERFQLLCANHHFEAHDAIDAEKRKRLSKICPVCEQPFYVPMDRRKNGRGKTCSKACETQWRFMSKSQPSAIRARMMNLVTVEENGCWLWTGDTVRGAPVMSMPNPDGSHQPRIARRVSFELHNRPLAPGELISPACKNPLCVNPDHMAVITDTERAAMAKANGNTTQGEKAANAVLTEENVRHILRVYDGTRGQLRRLGRELDVAWQTVADVAHRRTWTHIDL